MIIFLSLLLSKEIIFSQFNQFQIGSKTREVYCSKRGEKDENNSLILYFHGTSEDVLKYQKSYWYKHVPNNTIICAPKSDIGPSEFEWHIVLSDDLDDIELSDNLITALGTQIDRKKIHLMGFSAGGIHVAHMTFLRQNMIASSVIFSGGFLIENSYNNTIVPPTMIYNGGHLDSVALVSFQTATNRYISEAMNKNSILFVCEHNKGHKITELEQASAINFLKITNFANYTKPKDCLFKQSTIAQNENLLKDVDSSSLIIHGCNFFWLLYFLSGS
eukprot:NODE_4_length_77007_cov_1.156642.p37 type:complete len:275 gc:universal NODE_4_length_77007_cov_1.156642:62287-61463(-)